MGLGSVSPKLHILQHIAVVMSKMTDQWIFGGISSFGEIHVIWQQFCHPEGQDVMRKEIC